MVIDLFADRRPELRRGRVLSIFGPPITRTSEKLEINPRVINAFQEVQDMTELAERALEAIDKHGEMLVVPISEDHNEVRAAHLRQGGDGKFITFSQFKLAINEIKISRADYAFNTNLNGYGFGDQRVLERGRMTRALNNYRNTNSSNTDPGWIEQMVGFGLGTLLMYGLNELLGTNHAQDHAAVTSAKFPPATEAPGVTDQIMRGIMMMIFLHGMTEQAIQGYINVTGQGEGSQFSTAIKDAFNAGPPKSAAYDLLRAGLASSDSEIIARHSVDYAARHIGDGFELWFAYLTTREMHERGLREGYSANLYRTGQLRGSDARAERLVQLANTGISGLVKMQSVLGNGLRPSDACCLTRFLLVVDVDFLDAIRAIIQMAIAILESQAALAFSATLANMSSPWAIIRSEVIRLVDGIIDKIVDRILVAFNIDNSVWNVIKACTPVTELMHSVLDQIEWIKRWYKNMLEMLGEELDGLQQNNLACWGIIDDINRAKEQLKVLDRIIQEKQAMLDADLPENQIFGIIDEIQCYRNTYDIPINVIDQISRDAKILASQDLTEGDRSMLIENIGRKLSAAGIPDETVARIRNELYDVAQEKNDTKLNQVLGYVEEAVGEETAVGQTIGGINNFTREAIEWCRNLGDWDRMKGLFGIEATVGTQEPQ